MVPPAAIIGHFVSLTSFGARAVPLKCVLSPVQRSWLLSGQGAALPPTPLLPALRPYFARIYGAESIDRTSAIIQRRSKGVDQAS